MALLFFGVCVCILAFLQICPDHKLYNNAWISKQFGTVVALEGQGHRGRIKFKMVIY